MLKIDLQFFGGRGASGGGSGGNSTLGRKGSPKTPEQAVANVNAANYNKERGYQINCQRCIWAYELQRRGYDVEALPNNDGLGAYGRWHSIVDGKLDKNYLGEPWGRNTNARNAKEAARIMGEWGEGSRGVIQFSRKSGSGHVFNVEYSGGKVHVYEAQTGKKMPSLSKYLSEQRADPSFVQIFRTDNLKFNNSEMPKYVKQRGK